MYERRVATVSSPSRKLLHKSELEYQQVERSGMVQQNKVQEGCGLSDEAGKSARDPEPENLRSPA